MMDGNKRKYTNDESNNLSSVVTPEKTKKPCSELSPIVNSSQNDSDDATVDASNCQDGREESVLDSGTFIDQEALIADIADYQEKMEREQRQRAEQKLKEAQQPNDLTVQDAVSHHEHNEQCRAMEDIVRYEQDEELTRKEQKSTQQRKTFGTVEKTVDAFEHASYVGDQILCSREVNDKNDYDEDNGLTAHDDSWNLMTYRSPAGQIDYVTPHKEYPEQGKGIARYVTVTKPRFDQVFSTFFHFKDRGYNSNNHKIINGLIREWRKGIIEMVEKLDTMKTIVDRQGYRNQKKFAESKALLIQHGISKYDEFPVKILNMRWMKKMIPAIKTDEDAMFLYHISNSKSFELRAMREKKSGEVSIITRFDDKRNVLLGYH